MTTTVTITGSGTPLLAPERAGPGALIRHDDTLVQVDVGRATTLRLTEAGLTSLTEWVQNGPQPYDPPPVHCPAGPAVDYLEHLFDHLGPDLESRRSVSGYPDDPHPRIVPFDVSTTGPIHVAEIGAISVDAALVDHGDLAPAVAYRFTTPDGVIVISGDTCACPAVEDLAQGADVLVHEVLSSALLAARGAPPSLIEKLAHHHTEAKALGALAARIDTPALVATHLVPPPVDADQQAVFEQAIREGGYTGNLTIAKDLHTTTL